METCFVRWGSFFSAKFKIDLIVWKLFNDKVAFEYKTLFKIDLIVWKPNTPTHHQLWRNSLK